MIATSFQPEYHVGNYDIAMGMIYAVTGVKTLPVFPRKQFRPVRMAYMSVVNGKLPVQRMLELDRHLGLDLTFVNSADILQGVLEHSDVLVVPCGGKWFPGVVKVYRKSLIGFMERGGRIFAGGDEEMRQLLKHENFIVLPEKQSFEAEILKNL